MRALACAGHDGRGQRMLARLLERGGEPQHVGLLIGRRRARPPPASACPRSACRSCRRRACRRVSSRSSASALSDQHAGAGAAAGADHDRHRRRQAERARARDDQHGDGADQRVRQPRLAAPRALQATKASDGDERRPRARNSRRSGRPAAESARGCAAPRRPCATICASSVSLPTRSARISSAAVAVDRAAGDRGCRGSFSTGIGSPVTIDSSTALRPSTHRRRRRGSSRRAERAACRRPATVAERHIALLGRPDDAAPSSAPGRAAARIAAAGPAARAQLEHLAEQDEHGDHGRGVEVGLDHAVHAEAGGKQPRRQRRGDAVARTRRRRRARSA